MSFSEPEQIVATLGLRDSMQIADIGSGSGFYSIAAARAVAPGGMVYAVDIQKSLLERLVEEAARNNVRNIKTVWGDAEDPQGTHLRDASIDVVIVANIFFQVENKSAMVTEIDRILKPSGKVLVVDWTESFGGLGPQGGQLFPEQQAKTLFETHGYTASQNIPAGEHHYGIVFKK